LWWRRMTCTSRCSSRMIHPDPAQLWQRIAMMG
jgi:hypothetical protein